MMRLGGRVVQIESSTSSVAKGETLQDTIRCLECYADVSVLRSPVKGAAATAASVARRPVINAGDGTGEHPTQALLDIYTIHRELGGVEGKTVTMIGDLKNGRTVHSLSRLLRLFPGVQLNFVAPPELRMPADILAELTAAGVVCRESAALEDVIGASDVLYVTRVQKERFADAAEYERLKHAFIITPAVMARAKPVMALLHPLPRVGEITDEVDSDPRAAYFRQMENGMYVRMSLLAHILGKEAQM